MPQHNLQLEKFYFLHILFKDPSSQGWPYKWTQIIAFVFLLIFFLFVLSQYYRLIY